MDKFEAGNEECIEVTFSNGDKGLVRYPTGEELDAFFDKIEESKADGSGSYDVFYDYVAKLGAETSKPIEIGQLKSMQMRRFKALMSELNGTSEKKS